MRPLGIGFNAVHSLKNSVNDGERVHANVFNVNSKLLTFRHNGVDFVPGCKDSKSKCLA